MKIHQSFDLIDGMDFRYTYKRATKSEGEREDEETERLVRPNPKLKPPRHDRRRERVNLDQDPDLKDPTNVEADPDLSKNYKKVADDKLISVRLKDDSKKVVQVTKDTLKSSPDKYEPLKDKDQGQDEEQETQSPEVEEPQESQDVDWSEANSSLRDMAKTDEEFAYILKDFINPKSDIFQWAKERPDTPVKQFLRGRTPPKGITTMGDLQQALSYKPSAQPAPAPKKTEEPAPAESAQQPQETDSEQRQPVSEPGQDGRPERPFSKEERALARLQIIRTFPVKAAASLIRIEPALHPDEVTKLIANYKVAKEVPLKLNKIESLKDSASKFYALDPAQIPPPKTAEHEGEKTAFEDLPDEAKAKALRSHQVQTIAMSLAARDAIATTLEKKAGAPKELADTLSGFMLAGRTEAPEDRQKRATAKAEALFYDGLSEPKDDRPVPLGTVKKVLSSVKDPASQAVAVGYFQARDYNEARSRFLNPRSEFHISEQQSPAKIAKGIASAMEFLRERAERYPEGMSKDVATTFRARVVGLIGDLVPRKKTAVDDALDEVDNKFYDEALKKYRKAKKEYDRAKKKAETQAKKDYDEHSAKLKEGGNDDLDPPPTSLDRLAAQGILEPSEPIKPINYDVRRKSPEDLATSAEGIWDKFNSRFASGTQKSKEIVSRFKFSTYPNTTAMDRNRKAVYWGVEPEAVGAYPDWEQPQARDLNDQDFNKILASARNWMTSPVLSENVEGIVRDTQVRAALDLAIQTNNYRNAIHPAVYNKLLARLAGKPVDETLMTVTAGKAANEERLEMSDKVQFDKGTADRLLARLDRVASTIQKRHEDWGLGFDAAKSIVNEIDRIADELETASYGEESITTRQAQVLQRDSDEGYMDTFANPSSPHQTEADEPYMQAYGNDDSSGVHHGKAENGRPLAP